MGLIEDFVEKHCRDRYDGYPLIFGKNWDLDVKVPGHPEIYVSAPSDFEVVLEITSWRGISINAIHYYGRIHVKGPYLCRKYGNQIWRVGGFICAEWSVMSRAERKFVNEDFFIEIVRPLSQYEIDHDPERWEKFHPGIMINGFETKESLLDVASKVISLRFPDWKMTINDNT